MTFTLALLTTPLWLIAANPEVTTENVTYKDGDVTLVGHLAYDPNVTEKRPGVLVVHEWWGLNDHAKKAAERLVAMGYVAFALDMYGNGKSTEHPSEAGEWAGSIRKNQDAWVKRAQAGLAILEAHPKVDKTRLASIGYCFGGSTSIQLAMKEPNLVAAASFHGGLPKPTLEEAKAIKAKLLICHGSEDPLIPPAQIEAFEKVLNQAKVDWVFVAYAGAKHGFTNPDAGKYGVQALAYNESADRRSWQHLRLHLEEAFRDAK